MTPPILIVTLDAEWSLAPEAPAMLSLRGHGVRLAPHGPHALTQLALARPRLLVVEVLDVARHGLALAHIVRERPAFEQLPMIGITQDLDVEAQASLLLAGYDRLVASATRHRALVRTAEELMAAGSRVPGALEACGRVAARATRLALDHCAQVRTVS
jgi:CheY-like chemotaxis protein